MAGGSGRRYYWLRPRSSLVAEEGGTGTRCGWILCWALEGGETGKNNARQDRCYICSMLLCWLNPLAPIRLVPITMYTSFRRSRANHAGWPAAVSSGRPLRPDKGVDIKAVYGRSICAFYTLPPLVVYTVHP
jgi:hypothetical protein